MCKTLKVSSSGYYGWARRAPSARAVANAALTERIREDFMASDETYGMPRIRFELNEAGIGASRRRIARLMRQAHMRGVSRRRGYVVTTERDKRQRPAPDLVNRQFVADGLNQLWVADMTYIPTWDGFLYLAVVVDVFSRSGGMGLRREHDIGSGSGGASHGAADQKARVGDPPFRPG